MTGNFGDFMAGKRDKAQAAVADADAQREAAAADQARVSRIMQTRQARAHVVGDLVEENPLIGVPAALVIIWMQRMRDRNSRALASRYEQRRREQGATALVDGPLSPEDAADVRDFLGDTELGDGRIALDVWEAEHGQTPEPVQTPERTESVIGKLDRHMPDDGSGPDAPTERTR